MGRARTAAICAAAVMASATAAQSAVMQASLGGDYDDMDPALVAWSATLTYDTAHGVLTTTPTSQTLYWNSAMSTPSPLIDLLVEVDGTAGLTRDIQTATSFLIQRDLTDYYFQIVGSDFFLDVGYNGGLSPLDPPGTDLSLGAAYHHGPFGYSTVRGFDTINYSLVYTEALTVDKIGESAGVPEPASWALLLTGFAGLGVALRRRRAVQAAA